jgi:hypothetical protein
MFAIDEASFRLEGLRVAIELLQHRVWRNPGPLTGSKAAKKRVRTFFFIRIGGENILFETQVGSEKVTVVSCQRLYAPQCAS